MKIAVWHNLPSGGGKRALYYHIQGLLKRGHQIEAWCPPSPDRAFLPLDDHLIEHCPPCRSIAWLPSRSGNSLQQLLAVYRYQKDKVQALDEHCRLCADEINHENFDVLFANSDKYMRVVSIGRFTKLPNAIYLGEPNRDLYEANPQLKWLAFPPRTPEVGIFHYIQEYARDLLEVHGARFLAREEWLNACAFNLIMVNSLYTRESVQRAYGLEAEICYPGVDTDLFRPQDRPRENFVIGVGSLVRAKGVDRAIRAVAAIPEKLRPSLVWIANFANPGYLLEMQHMAASVGVQFECHVQVSDDDLIGWLSRATLMIYTSYLEPFGLAPLEANACQTPVVALPEGGVRESIQDGINGVLVNESRPQALAEAMTKMLEHPSQTKEMGRVARQYVIENWSWDRAVNCLEKRLQGLICGN